MRKILFSVSALLGMVVLLNSCEKEITSTAVVIDETKTASFKLYVKAELDIDEDGAENAPDGTIFKFSILNEDLSEADVTSGRWIKMDTVQGGYIQLDIPATDDGVELKIDGVEFEYMYELTDSTRELRSYYYAGSFSGIVSGTSEIHSVDMQYRLLEEIND